MSEAVSFKDRCEKIGEGPLEPRTELKPVYIEAHDLGDAWFQCLYKILDDGYVYPITKGSYANDQHRLEFDYITIRIKHPEMRPIYPLMPEGCSIPAPTDMETIEKYFAQYIISSEKTNNEEYTYGERLCISVQQVIENYKTKGFGSNQEILQVGQPSDIMLPDPPCLRQIDTRIRYGKLHFMVYFRSWDLYGGLPTNLGGIQLLKEYMADAIGVEPGETIAASKGLHIYKYVGDVVETRTAKLMRVQK